MKVCIAYGMPQDKFIPWINEGPFLGALPQLIPPQRLGKSAILVKINLSDGNHVGNPPTRGAGQVRLLRQKMRAQKLLYWFGT
jgi:hypothetical protein